MAFQSFIEYLNLMTCESCLYNITDLYLKGCDDVTSTAQDAASPQQRKEYENGEEWKSNALK